MMSILAKGKYFLGPTSGGVIGSCYGSARLCGNCGNIGGWSTVGGICGVVGFSEDRQKLDLCWNLR